MLRVMRSRQKALPDARRGEGLRRSEGEQERAEGRPVYSRSHRAEKEDAAADTADESLNDSTGASALDCGR